MFFGKKRRRKEGGKKGESTFLFPGICTIMKVVQEDKRMATTKQIRFATKDDAAAILTIYAEYIKNTTVTFEIEVPTLELFQERMERIMAEFPWLVCEIDGEIAG